MKHEILLGLTTTPASDWRGKVEEMKKFGIKRIALFPTFLEIEDRKELYKLLEEIEDLEIPHVHLREQDMESWEMELFDKKFKTQVYNIHHGGSNECMIPYLEKIFVENRFKPFAEKDIEGYAGICADFSHMEDGRRRKKSKLDPVNDLMEKFKVGCCHVSAIKRNKFNPINLILGYDRHFLKNINEVDYLVNYKKYLPEFISLELENSFDRQLEVKKYLEKILEI